MIYVSPESTDAPKDPREDPREDPQEGPREAHRAGADDDAGVHAEYSAPVAAFVERLAGDLTEAGMQRMAARVFACLLVSEQGALSSAELGRRLRISPAAVSGAVRYLGQLHMLTRERVPGSRRERYRLHADVWYESLTSREALMNRWLNTFESGLAALEPGSPAGRRVAETGEFLAYLRDELHGVMERWRERREQQDADRPEPGSGRGEGEADG